MLDRTTEQPRYLVGIDLGTTNSAVAYIDTKKKKWTVADFAIAQLVAPGEVDRQPTLPSFHYEPGAELAAESMRLPWDAGDRRWAVGVVAREQGAASPGRTVSSAKSWLSHSGVDRTAGLLPWHAADDVERLSPVTVTSRYLVHLRDAWDDAHADAPLAEQDIVLTVPASFDQVARELTIEAARQAGLKRVVLVEEPQAAFYAWIDANRDRWQKKVQPGQRILVCDIGGGTTDFTLIRVRPGDDGGVIFHRVAVGEHLILGGDNLDLALARHVEGRLQKLDPARWGALLRASRSVKENLLGAEAPDRWTLSIAGGGSRLIGGSIQLDIARTEIEQLLVDGFLPKVKLSDRPAHRRSGFQEFGLPYAADAAITRYLAAFLNTHQHAGEQDGESTPTARPDYVLFNGGFFESPVLRDRLLAVMGEWFDGDAPAVLRNDKLDLAVARGAAYYGMVRRGKGVRISGGLAQAYYVAVDAGDGTAPPRSVCVLPAGLEAGKEVTLDLAFQLRIRTPVEFPLYVSSVRTTDKPGDVVAIDAEQMSALPPIRTVLQTAKNAPADTVTVHLHAQLTEVGTLELWFAEAAGNRRWRLQFDVRSTQRSDAEAHDGSAESQGVVDERIITACRQQVDPTFTPGGGAKPANLAKRLEEASELSRNEWPASLMRAIWAALADVEDGRRISAEHESRWLNMAGYTLRPGYGLAVDDWRVAQMWKLFAGGLRYPKNEQVRADWWVMWRRLAGGMVQGQQNLLAEPLLAAWRMWWRKQGAGLKWQSPTFQFGAHESAESWRLLGSLELLRATMKEEIGQLALDLLTVKRMATTMAGPLLFAIGRIGTRVPVYGPLNLLLPAEVAGQWLDQLMKLDLDPAGQSLAVMQLARRTGDRWRDISDDARKQAGNWLENRGANDHYLQLVRDGGDLMEQEQRSVFGEALPRGLRII